VSQRVAQAPTRLHADERSTFLIVERRCGLAHQPTGWVGDVADEIVVADGVGFGDVDLPTRESASGSSGCFWRGRDGVVCGRIAG